jgi:hypothetical protein
MKQRSFLTIAGALLIVVYFAVAIQSGWQGARESFFANVCARAGLVTLAAALAWPQLSHLGRRFPPWFWGTVAIALLIVVVRPRLFLAAIALVVLVSAIHGGLRWISTTMREK